MSWFIHQALAQTTIQINNPLGCEDGGACLQQLFNALFWLAVPLASIMILVGGFQIMFANGAEEKIKKGKTTILYAVIGFGIVVLSNGLVAVITDFLSKATQ